MLQSDWFHRASQVEALPKTRLMHLLLRRFGSSIRLIKDSGACVGHAATGGLEMWKYGWHKRFRVGSKGWNHPKYSLCFMKPVGIYRVEHHPPLARRLGAHQAVSRIARSRVRWERILLLLACKRAHDTLTLARKKKEICIQLIRTLCLAWPLLRRTVRAG